MFSLIQSKRARGHAGEPLPTVFRTLTEAETVFRLGQLVLVVAGPGTGKSAFVLTLALQSKVRALYFSADSDAFEQLVRAICVLTGSTVDAARAAVLQDNLGPIEPALAGIPVRMIYDASPTLDDIEDAVKAYVQLYGEYPELIVVDNITNVRTDSIEEGSQRLEDLMDWLHTTARVTGACVIGLHHVTGGYNDADKPIPLSGIRGQLGRVPEMVLSLFSPSPDRIGVSTVKNRGGKKDASGKTYVELVFQGDRMSIRDAYTPAEDDSSMTSHLTSVPDWSGNGSENQSTVGSRFEEW